MPPVWEKAGGATVKRPARASTGNRKSFWEIICLNMILSFLDNLATMRNSFRRNLIIITVWSSDLSKILIPHTNKLFSFS
jgi:hypothetical protein